MLLKLLFIYLFIIIIFLFFFLFPSQKLVAWTIRFTHKMILEDHSLVWLDQPYCEQIIHLFSTIRKPMPLVFF